jgi:hypothetical protein
MPSPRRHFCATKVVCIMNQEADTRDQGCAPCDFFSLEYGSLRTKCVVCPFTLLNATAVATNKLSITFSYKGFVVTGLDDMHY